MEECHFNNTHEKVQPVIVLYHAADPPDSLLKNLGMAMNQTCIVSDHIVSDRIVSEASHHQVDKIWVGFFSTSNKIKDTVRSAEFPNQSLVVFEPKMMCS